MWRATQPAARRRPLLDEEIDDGKISRCSPEHARRILNSCAGNSAIKLYRPPNHAEGDLCGHLALNGHIEASSRWPLSGSGKHLLALSFFSADPLADIG